jgi:hypothetical protein
LSGDAWGGRERSGGSWQSFAARSRRDPFDENSPVSESDLEVEVAQKVDAEHAIDPVSKVGNDHAMIGHREAERRNFRPNDSPRSSAAAVRVTLQPTRSADEYPIDSATLGTMVVKTAAVSKMSFT